MRLAKRTGKSVAVDRDLHARTPAANIQTVDDLICSQEDRSGSRKRVQEKFHAKRAFRAHLCAAQPRKIFILKHFDDARCNCSPTPTFAKDLLPANNWKKTFNRCVWPSKGHNIRFLQNVTDSDNTVCSLFARDATSELLCCVTRIQQTNAILLKE